MTALSGTGDKYKNYYVSSIITSGKNFIKITSVGMGAAKSNEQGRNGNVGEFRHMTTSFFSSCENPCL